MKLIDDLFIIKYLFYFDFLDNVVRNKIKYNICIIISMDTIQLIF